MPTQITIQEQGDMLWTMHNGKLRAWSVEEDGSIKEEDTEQQMKLKAMGWE